MKQLADVFAMMIVAFAWQKESLMLQFCLQDIQVRPIALVVRGGRSRVVNIAAAFDVHQQ